MRFPFLLAVHTYPAGSNALLRHAPYFKRAGAVRDVAITTEDGECRIPQGWEAQPIRKNSYMDAQHLPLRLLETISWCLGQPQNHFVIAEYDTLFLKPVRPFTGICCDRTGGKTWNSAANWYGHNPWMLDRDSAYPLVNEMVRILAEGHCQYGTPESSPDVFFGYACERAGLAVNHDHFRLFTRNCFDVGNDLQLAREAFQSGEYDALHGCKTQREFEFITAP
jgi:hypothetical protein